MFRDSLAAFQDLHASSRKVFVVGMGRSGTHFVAESLAAHPQITANIEDRVIFPQVVAVAINERKERYRYPIIEFLYRTAHARVAPDHLVDKSHPAIWIADRLASSFPNALFIGMSRNPYATVASGLQLPWVSRWHSQWRRYPVPNRFLGITLDMVDSYDLFSRAEQLTIRWLAHQTQLRYLAKTLSNRFLLVTYEDLVLKPDEQLARIADALQLESPIPTPIVRKESLERWRSELNKDAVAAIGRLLSDS